MSLDLQLSELRRSLDVATTKIDGQLAVLLQKSDYAEQRARESAERIAVELAARDIRLAAHEKRFEDGEKEVSALKAKLYFLSGMAAALGSIPGIVTLITKH